MFCSPTLASPTLALTQTPAPELPNALSTVVQPRRSTRSNLGQPPGVLDPSSHFVTQHTGFTEHLSAPPNTSPIEQYCNTLGIRKLSGRYGRTSSQGGCKRILHTSKLTERDSYPIILHYCLNPLYLVTLKWSKLNNGMDSGLSTLNAFSYSSTEAMTGHDFAVVMNAKEKELETIIEIKALVVVDKEPWMNIVPSVWAFRHKKISNSQTKSSYFCTRL